MAVQVQSNNLPNQAAHDAVQSAVLESIGNPGGNWSVQIHERQDSPAWYITIWGPDDFQWTREFFGIKEQSSLDGYAFIRRAVSRLFLPPQAPIYVESLRLKDFRCFVDLDVTFNRRSRLEGKWACIAGINGAGKSTVMQAVALALLGTPLALELGGGRLNRQRRLADAFNRKRAEIELVIADGADRFQLGLDIDEGRIASTASPPSGSPWEDLRRAVIVGYGATRNLPPQSDSEYDTLSADVRNVFTLFDAATELRGARVLLASRPADADKVTLTLLKNLLPQVFGDDLTIEIDFPPVRFTVGDRDFVEAIDLPDGFRSAVAWITDLCSVWCEKAPSQAAKGNPADIQAIVLIDEIDLHLHPALQRSIVPRLRAAMPKVQWIVTTHSPLVLANFDKDEIVALDRTVEGNVRLLDRQIMGFSSNEIYEWLMGTEPTGEAMERKLEESNGDEIAELLETSPKISDADARARIQHLKGAIERLKP